MADNIKDFAVNSARWLSLEDFEGEIWKDVPDYERWYQVSNLGRVKSLERHITDSNRQNRTVCYKERIIKQFVSRTGYYTLHLTKNSKIRIFTAHKLVALAYIPNPNKYPCINHKDETRTNNNVDNLEWCTYKYNTNYGTCIQRVTAKNLLREDLAKPVYQYDIDGNFICKHHSARSIARNLGFSIRSIREVLYGKHTSSHGYIWLREKDDEKAKSISNQCHNPKNKKKVVQYSLDGNKIAEYNSVLEAARITNISNTTIGRCCNSNGYHKTAGGYKWEFK